MSRNDVGVYQLSNGYWGFRYALMSDGIRKECKMSKDAFGNPLKTKKAAIKARQLEISRVKLGIINNDVPQTKKTVSDVYTEYCNVGRIGKAYATIKKQDSLWNNHIAAAFGNRLINSISVAEIQDYLATLYYGENRAYSYVESFLKMFYLIFGQAYSRNYLDVDTYNKLCVNKDTKIRMPKMKVDDDTDIVTFSKVEISALNDYFKGTNAETAFLLGRYCGLRINECYGLKWNNIDLENGVINIDRQMQYQEGLIKLVSLKTRNARRKIYMCNRLKDYFTKLKNNVSEYEKKYFLQRQQNKTIITDIDGSSLSSLELVNSLPNGKIQTVNSMKYHTQKIKSLYDIAFKYHYLRHTYGTYLAELNTPLHILCNQMGHANSQVTQRYYIAMSENGIKELVNNLERI